MTLHEHNQVTRLAKLLWSEEVPPKVNCRAEVGREGQLCRICTAAQEQWDAKLWELYNALIKAEFSI